MEEGKEEVFGMVTPSEVMKAVKVETGKEGPPSEMMRVRPPSEMVLVPPSEIE